MLKKYNILNRIIFCFNGFFNFKKLKKNILQFAE